MDGDGELQLGDDVNTSLPCASESAERHSGNNMKDARDTGTNDNNNNGTGGGGGSSGSGSGDAGGGGDDDDDGGEDEDKGKDDDDDEDEEKGKDDDDDEDEDDGEDDEDEYCEEMRDNEDEDDDSEEDRMHIDIPDEEEEEDDDQDSTDGEPPSSCGALDTVAEATVTTDKRVPVQSQRMRDYQAMQQTASQSSRPRPCPHCDRILYSGPGFRYHLSTHHTGKESFTCEFCHRKFKSLNGLKYHQKRKRCKVLAASQASAAAAAMPICTTTVSPLHTHTRANFEEDVPCQRLMELAKIATSPQSPLLQSPGPDSRGGSSVTFFDYSEESAAMTLSRMRSSESRKSLEACASSTTKFFSVQHPYQQYQYPQQQQPLHRQHNPPAQDTKSKRPMNGFMLFAQQHRAELKKKYPNTNNREISTKLSEEWARLPDDVRQHWKDEAKVKAEQQLKEHPDCWKRKK